MQEIRKKQNLKKRHHYMPVFYLNGFTNAEGLLWAYKKENGDMFESTPDGIAYTKDYFSFINIEGKKDTQTIEDAIAKLEGICAKVIKRILACDSLSEEDRYIFSIFVSLMMVRSPNHRKNIEKVIEDTAKFYNKFIASDEKSFKAMVERYEKHIGKSYGTPEEVKKLKQFMLGEDENFILKANPEVSLKMLLTQIYDFAKVFYAMSWVFIQATDDYKYLTGDNPFYYSDPTYNPYSFYGVGLANKNIEVTLPLSKDIIAFGAWEKKLKQAYIQGKNQFIKECNRRTVIASWKFLFASEGSDNIKRLAVKYKDSAPSMKVG